MFLNPPPPPPPPPPPHISAAQTPPAQLAVTGYLPVTQPPPPPPPPTMSSTCVTWASSVFNGTSPQSNNHTRVIFPLNQPPPPLPPMFDASRPPPPLAGQSKNGAIKHRLESCEAGPSKIRKQEGSKVAENCCENCVLRELRIEFYNQQMDKLHYEKEHQSQLYKKKLEEFENSKELLRSFVGEDLFRILDEYVEDEPTQLQDVQAQSASLTLGSSNIPRPLMSQLFEYAISNSRSPVESAPASSLRLDEPVLQPMSTRRTNSYSNSPSSELVHTILQVLCNSNTTIDRSHNISRSMEAESSAPSSPSASCFANGQKTESHAGAGARSAGADAGRGNAAAAGARAVPAAPARAAFYPPYRPGVPPPAAAPPTRPYYPQPYAAPPVGPPNVQFNASPRVRPPAATQMPAWPSAAAAQRAHNQFMMGGFPFPPHFYPPYQ